MHVTRVRFWILAIVLFLYLAGVLILSAVTLHEPRSNHSGKATHSQLKLRNFIEFNNNNNNLPNNLRLSASLRRSKIQWCATLQFFEPPKNYLVALASFPGSGNTWLRYLLQQATGIYTGSIYKDYGLLKNGFPAENVVNGSVLVVKTHEYGADAKKQFAKAILLVRAPTKAIQAEFNRQNGGHIGYASPERYQRTKGKYWKQFVYNKLEAWKMTNLYWLYNFTGPTHVIFYEQLVSNLESTLKSVVEFLNVTSSSSTADLFECAIRHKEGIYRRKRRLIHFDPFTSEMKESINRVQQKVYEAIYNFAMPSS